VSVGDPEPFPPAGDVDAVPDVPTAGEVFVAGGDVLVVAVPFDLVADGLTLPDDPTTPAMGFRPGASSPEDAVAAALALCADCRLVCVGIVVWLD
jgi:hypothetical protein